MSEASRVFAHRWFEEVWNQGREESIDELFLPEGQCFDFSAPGSTIGRDEFKDSIRVFRSAFSNIHVTIEDVISEEHKIAIRWTAEMTHSGPGLGFAATEAPVKFAGISFVELREGRILKGWNAFDLTTIVNHLRSLPSSK